MSRFRVLFGLGLFVVGCSPTTNIVSGVGTSGSAAAQPHVDAAERLVVEPAPRLASLRTVPSIAGYEQRIIADGQRAGVSSRQPWIASPSNASETTSSRSCWWIRWPRAYGLSDADSLSANVEMQRN